MTTAPGNHRTPAAHPLPPSNRAAGSTPRGPTQEGTVFVPVRTTPGTALAGITLPDAGTGQPWDLNTLRGTWLLTAIHHHL